MPADRPGWFRRHRIGCLVIFLLILALTAPWWLLSRSSPLSPWLYERLGRWAITDTPLALQLRGIGFDTLFRRFTVSRLTVEAADYASLTLDNLTLRHRLRPLLVSRVSLKRVELQNLGLRVDSTRPVPAWTSTAPLPVTFDLDHLPDMQIDQVFLLYRLLVTTGSPPATVVFSNVHLVVRQESPARGHLPMTFQMSGDVQFDTGRPSRFECRGRTDPSSLATRAARLDLDATIREFHLPDLNPLLAPLAPFQIESGGLTYYLNLRCREGTLSGLASISASNVHIRRQEHAVGQRTLQASFQSWQALARQRNGVIEADCPIGGTLWEPHIPLGSVLRDQARQAGRNVAAKALSRLPASGGRSVGDNLESAGHDRARYDHILKIERYPPDEQHFERARHYHHVVRNYPEAATEYRRQLAQFPGREDLAVRSLQGLAELQRRPLNDRAGALASLRQIVDGHPRHPEADDALSKMIDWCMEDRDYRQASALCSEFQTLFVHSAFTDHVRRQQKQVSSFAW
jgi:hypothetical protein